MTDSLIQYRLIKKEKHIGARSRNYHPHGTFPTLNVFYDLGLRQPLITQSPEELAKEMGSGIIWPTPTISGFVPGTTGRKR